MPRGPRIDAPGAVQHVIVRGIERRPIFRDDRDRLEWVARMRRLLPENGMRCLAWALMPNHAHLLLQTGASSVSRLMARLNTSYAVFFNRRHARSGHLFQNRFYSRLARDDADVVGLVRYVHRNPLEAGLVDSLEALCDFRWCGHGALAGRRPPHAFESVSATLAWFGECEAEARRNLASLMARSEADSAATSLPGDEPSFPVERLPLDPEETFDGLVARVCEEFALDPATLRGPGRPRSVSRARAVIAFSAVHRLGESSTRIAAALGVSPSGVTRAARRGAEIVGRALRASPKSQKSKNVPTPGRATRARR